MGTVDVTKDSVETVRHCTLPNMQKYKSILVLCGDSSMSLGYATTKGPHTCLLLRSPSPSDPVSPYVEDLTSLPETWAAAHSVLLSKAGQSG